MPSPARALALSASQKAELEGLVRSGNTPQKVALRCRLLLLANQGVANQSIAEQVDLSRPTVGALRAAFARGGLPPVTDVRKRNRRGSVLTPELVRILPKSITHSPLIPITILLKAISEVGAKRRWLFHSDRG